MNRTEAERDCNKTKQNKKTARITEPCGCVIIHLLPAIYHIVLWCKCSQFRTSMVQLQGAATRPNLNGSLIPAHDEYSTLSVVIDLKRPPSFIERQSAYAQPIENASKHISTCLTASNHDVTCRFAAVSARSRTASSETTRRRRR